MADLLFPRCCEVCGRELLVNEDFLCLECYAQIPFTYFWQMEENPAERAFWGRARIEGVCSLFYYTDSYKKLVHSLKYRSNIGIGLWLGEMLGSRLPFEVDYIIPVPLHWRKRWSRGYNQSEIIAKGIARGYSNVVARGYSGEVAKWKARSRGSSPEILTGVLRRRVFTSTQTQKDRFDRWLNVRGAFNLAPGSIAKYDLNGKNILLIDDVLTSGATLDACANLLLSNYDCKVYIATLAYVE